MFGIDNVGVINQRNAPAIWTSPIADFPPNNIQGRLLLATDTVTLYVDLINGTGGVTNRAIIASGLIGNGSGTTINNIGTGDYFVDLGGALQSDVNIDFDGRQMTFQGQVELVNINIDGYLQSGSSGTYMPATEQPFFALIPDAVLEFTDGVTSTQYQVLAKIK
jgi:hypothetical protein